MYGSEVGAPSKNRKSAGGAAKKAAPESDADPITSACNKVHAAEEEAL